MTTRKDVQQQRPRFIREVSHGVNSGELIGEAATLAGAVLSNSRSRAVIEVKIDELSRHVEKHDCLAERAYRLEKNVAVIRRDVGLIDERIGR